MLTAAHTMCRLLHIIRDVSLNLSFSRSLSLYTIYIYTCALTSRDIYIYIYVYINIYIHIYNTIVIIYTMYVVILSYPLRPFVPRSNECPGNSRAAALSTAVETLQPQRNKGRPSIHWNGTEHACQSTPRDYISMQSQQRLMCYLRVSLFASV